MDIENLLTLGLAAAVLVVAALLRLFVVGAVRLYLKLSGKKLPGRETAVRPQARRPRRARRPIARPALNGLGSLGGGLVFALATVGTWMRSVGTVIARAAASAYASASPRVASGTQKGLSTAGHKLRSAAIVTLASGQHLGRITAHRVKEIADERSARNVAEPEEEPPEERVIVLDREWDPLTDPLEDEPASNLR